MPFNSLFIPLFFIFQSILKPCISLSFAFSLQNDLDTLQGLIDKWREACQLAVSRLHEKHPDPRPSLGDFISSCRLDNDLLGFNEDEETFS